jgi:N-acetylglucosaminyl-diphospho-decaprenol L-rhamnosyltransferase
MLAADRVNQGEVRMTDVEVAVIIVTYKSAQLTINSLVSVERELIASGLRLQVIVVDNASWDLEEIERAAASNKWSKWLTLIQAERNGGFAYGNNLGIRCAYQSGAPEYLYLLNPDTEVRLGAIVTLVRFMRENPAVGIAGSSFELADGTEWPIAFRFPTLVSEIIGGIGLGLLTRLFRRWEVAQQMSNDSQPIDWICGASMMIRPALIETIGGLDENYFLYFEETDFCLRAKRAGFATWYVPESRIMHIVGQSTKVTEITARPRRRPAYWFESRRRYFAVNAGLAQAIFVDIVAICACFLGSIKRMILGRRQAGTPHYIRDLMDHSVILPRNQALPALRSFRPPA